jgi:hypothetical protein
LTVWLGRPLIGLSFTQSDREASFRADLVHVRANAESVALPAPRGPAAHAPAAPRRRADRERAAA